MSVTPNVAGYKDAMDRLRSALGQDVTFKVPEAVTWPAGVELDPETGQPYDHTVEPESGGGFTEVVVHVGVVNQTFRTANPKDEVPDAAGGIERTGLVVLNCSLADYPTVEPATEFTLNGIDYRVTDREATGLTSVDRWMIFGEAK
jgi:hypothetical protein